MFSDKFIFTSTKKGILNRVPTQVKFDFDGRFDQVDNGFWFA